MHLGTILTRSSYPIHILILRIWLCYNLYLILETLLTILHELEILPLGPLHTIFQLRASLSSKLFTTIYRPLSPLLNAVFWGLMAKCAVQDNQDTTLTRWERYTHLTLPVAAMSVAAVWLRNECYGSDLDSGPGSAGECKLDGGGSTFVFSRPCVEAVCGVVLSFGTMAASWWGWAWDFGVWDCLWGKGGREVGEKDLLHRKEDEKKMAEREETSERTRL